MTDPAHLMVALGALCAFVAAVFWWRFSTVSDVLATPEGWQARRWLGHAGTLTALALGLASVGYLFGRLTGRF